MDAVPGQLTAEPDPSSAAAVPPVARIHGIDLARGLAMFGMVVAHYVWASQDTGPAAVVARAMEGRAMPLFMLLGGVGVVLVTRRSASPDRGLVIRAAILLGLGLLLDATVDRLAIVLQFYGLLFLLAPVLRRLPSPVLLASAALSAVIGGWSFQTVGQPRQRSSFEVIGEGWPFLRSLLFDGYYPFFPVFAFFAVGIVLARLDLRDQRLAITLAVVGTAVGVGTVLAADAVAGALSVDPAGVVADGTFDGARLLDVTGHSAMPAWVISATGTSVAVLGLSLLAARAMPALTRPVAVLGTVALSFYVFQAVATLVVTSPAETGLAREWVTVAILYGGFTAAAMVWKRWFRAGPLEALLRVGSGPRRPVGQPTSRPRTS